MSDPRDVARFAAGAALAAVDLRESLTALGHEFPQLFEDTDLSEQAGRRVFKARQEQALRMQQGLPVEPKSDYDLMREACQYVQERYVRSESLHSEPQPIRHEVPRRSAAISNRPESASTPMDAESILERDRKAAVEKLASARGKDVTVGDNPQHFYTD